jgi:hypothetical protein
MIFISNSGAPYSAEPAELAARLNRDGACSKIFRTVLQ